MARHGHMPRHLVCRTGVKDYPVKALFSSAELRNGTAFASCYLCTEKEALLLAVLSGLHPRLGEKRYLNMLDNDIARYTLTGLVFLQDMMFFPIPLFIGPFDHICC